jgi:hypothetical protein
MFSRPKCHAVWCCNCRTTRFKLSRPTVLSNRAATLRKPFIRRIESYLGSSAKHKMGQWYCRKRRLPSSCRSPCARSKPRVLTAGRLVGGCSFGRLLCNRFYRGEVVHKGTVQPGKQKAIVDEERWNAVQARLARRTHRRRAWRGKYEISLSLRLAAGWGILEFAALLRAAAVWAALANPKLHWRTPLPAMLPRLSIIDGNRCVARP